ncbi:DUF2178 domain-containing protein [uncultured Methanoregula sp.]|uniref:DUF2178 domain-containing protein n=1 Tax=uncultured Methanoregula sp. TaxID=1005933 RepID=UPI002AAABAA5|nr:DUF2178 domain-containing protein [uncultured Methanoregula sp.]
MKYLTYLAGTFLTACLVAALIGWSIAAGNFLIPIIAIPLGLIVILACRRNVKEVIGDERVNKIQSRAAFRTLEVLVILGAIMSVILYSYIVSDPLAPTIKGRVFTNDNGTSSMIINMYQPGSTETPENLTRSTTIKDINAMNESEAMDYCQFRREAFLENERKGIVGMTIGCSVFTLLVTFGAFYLYYNRKY